MAVLTKTRSRSAKPGQHKKSNALEHGNTGAAETLAGPQKELIHRLLKRRCKLCEEGSYQRTRPSPAARPQ